MRSKRNPFSYVIRDQDRMLIICSSLKTKQQSANHMCACTRTHAHRREKLGLQKDSATQKEET